MESLEQELEDVKTAHEEAILELQQQSEVQMVNLKQMFEADKLKF